MKALARTLAFVIALSCAACGGGNVEGTIEGKPFQMYGGFSTVVVNSDISGLLLVLTDRGNLCASGDLAGSRAVMIQLGITSPDGPGELATVAGKYFIVASAHSTPGEKFALVVAFDFQAACANQGPLAQSGTVTIHHLERGDGGVPTRVVGELDVHFFGNDSLSGSFDVQACPHPELHQGQCR